jgi:transcriptional regulator with XRE-family HTH domain
MTQHDLARAAGMPQPSIARIEGGSVLPRTATVLAILDATGHELLVEPRIAVRPELRLAARERLSRSVPRRVWDASRPARATSILRALRRAGVRFVLVGDLAEVVRGAPRSIGREVEICHASSAPAVERLAAALSEMGASPSVDAAHLRAHDGIRVATHAGDLRLVSVTAAGDDYDRLVRAASRLLIDTSLVVQVAALEDLMRIRRARRQDADIEMLAAVQRELTPGGAG